MTNYIQIFGTVWDDKKPGESVFYLTPHDYYAFRTKIRVLCCPDSAKYELDKGEKAQVMGIPFLDGGELKIEHADITILKQ